MVLGDFIKEEEKPFPIDKLEKISKRKLEYFHAITHLLGNPEFHEKVVEEMMEREISHLDIDILDALIKDFQNYNPKKMDTRVLQDDWRIVSAWFSSIREGKDFKFTEEEVVKLAKRIYLELRNREVEFHPETMKEHSLELYKLVSKKELAEGQYPIEDIDDVFLKKLDKEQLLEIHDLVHAYAKMEGLAEPVVNAHIFIVSEFERRGMEHPELKVAPDLDKRSRPTIEEYPSAPKGLNKRWELEEVVESFPDSLEISEPFVYLTGGIVNRGYSDISEDGKGSEHDIDILVRQAWTNRAVLSALLQALPKALRNNVQFIWSMDEPKVGFFLPLYRQVLHKISSQALSEEVKVFQKIRPLKAASGFEKFEFFDLKSLWESWGAKNIERGVYIQKKADGMRMLIHREGDEIKIITEDQQRDRAKMFPHVLPEIKKLPGKSFILDTEMVVHNPCSKGRPPKECDAKPREDMIPFIAKEKPPLPEDDRVVFWVHDVLYLNGESMINKPYSERWSLVEKEIPAEATHLARMPNWVATDRKSFERGIEKATKVLGTEGAMLKTADSVYKMKGRTRDWAKLKLTKEIDVMVYKKEPVKDQPGVFSYWACIGPVEDPEKWSPSHIVEHEGKKYLAIGKTYNTPHDVPIGGILEVDTIRIRQYEDSKGVPYLTWMFPAVRRPRPDKKTPDPVSTAIKISKVGAGALQLSDYYIDLDPCPSFDEEEVCPLKQLYEKPFDLDELSRFRESLRFPIACPLADKFRCRYVKPYYYEYRSEPDSD